MFTKFSHLLITLNFEILNEFEEFKANYKSSNIKEFKKKVLPNQFKDAKRTLIDNINKESIKNCEEMRNSNKVLNSDITKVLMNLIK